MVRRQGRGDGTRHGRDRRGAVQDPLPGLEQPMGLLGGPVERRSDGGHGGEQGQEHGQGQGQGRRQGYRHWREGRGQGCGQGCGEEEAEQGRREEERQQKGEDFQEGRRRRRRARGGRRRARRRARACAAQVQPLHLAQARAHRRVGEDHPRGEAGAAPAIGHRLDGARALRVGNEGQGEIPGAGGDGDRDLLGAPLVLRQVLESGAPLRPGAHAG